MKPVGCLFGELGGKVYRNARETESSKKLLPSEETGD